MIFKRILIAIDGGNASNKAIRHGLDLAHALQADVKTIFVFEGPAPQASEIGLSGGELMEAAGAEDRRVIDAARRAVQIPEGTPHVLRVGQAARVIVDVARDWPADLIVLGSHGRHGLARALLGSVAESVVRHSPCPVLVVRADGPNSARRAQSATPERS